ncbi:hypothetical protein DNTS_003655 [Danionella cerebrum]|uniref:G-protein coupled receptors family 2 profile 2 domain-containing protein n=1 Tax=Danionella cerebrum TaxID=2873325 RepID=A0A553RCG2_9TELE|nr:hypothetical protein DNTS_003655 [Danionella translucida]
MMVDINDVYPSKENTMKLHQSFIIWTLLITCDGMKSIHPECLIVFHLQEKEAECHSKISVLDVNATKTGCHMDWDGLNCWPEVSLGETVSVNCPPPLLKTHDLITRTCTGEGWSSLNVSYFDACFLDNSTETEAGLRREYFAKLACVRRKLLCMRTYVHLNLFSTFILRALAVFVKDAVLFSDETLDHCTVSTNLCKAVVTFFQFCVLSNFSWLLMEGLYLHTLLVFTFAHKRTFFWCYTLIGWGTPSVTITIWMLLKRKYDNHGRLARSTLLLIPLFGVHYVVFALFPEHVGLEARLFFELVLGSFQGFIVALLYCFLNSEVRFCFVQTEIRKAIERYKSRTDITFHMGTQDFTAEA